MKSLDQKKNTSSPVKCEGPSNRFLRLQWNSPGPYLFAYPTVVIPQPHYSPGMALYAFFLFPKHKRVLEGQLFSTIDEIKVKS